MGETSAHRGGHVPLTSRYAGKLEELVIPWQAARPDQPSLAALNVPLARQLGLDASWLRSESGIRFLLGNELPDSAKPVAQAYAGHQFGAYVPRLGDGRALLLGELRDIDGHIVDIHLKGSGKTPFARADGFAALGPMLREYVMGEAMHALGIPTTRALAVVGTGEVVRRPPEVLSGAVLARVASSHLRVGTFQYARGSGDVELLRRLADFAIARHYPELADSAEPYAELLTAVTRAQAELVAQWMLVGFVHGVMNTDNTTISGETIDYGPCAFIDAYDPAAVFSSIDHRGRYAFANQPGIALWNLSRLADSLLPLLGTDQDAAVKTAEKRLQAFHEHHEWALLAGMRAKLGVPGASDEAVGRIAKPLLAQLHAQRIDYHLFFRALADSARGDSAAFDALFEGSGAAPSGEWFDAWLALQPDAAAMDAANPLYVPRNHIVEEVLEAATRGDLEPFEELVDVLAHPYEQRPGLERFAATPEPGAWPHVTYCGT